MKKIPINKILSLIKREFDFKAYKPATATLELTYRCNLFCQTCRVPEMGIKRHKEELTTEEIINVIGDLKKIGVKEIALVGAEPLLRKDIAEIIDAVVENNIMCSITTNGTLFSEKNVNILLGGGLSVLNISIDSPDTTHNDIRGKAIFKSLTDSVTSLVEARNLKNQIYPKINIHCTISSLNANLVSGMIPLCENLGVDSLSFQYLSETSADEVKKSTLDGLEVASERFIPSNGSLLMSREQYPEFKEELDKVISYKGLLKTSHHSVSTLSKTSFLDGDFPIKKCYWINTHIIVDPYGNIYPCANIDRYYYGNIRQEKLSDIWHGKKAKAMRKQIEKEMLPVCKNCCHFNKNLTLPQIIKNFLLKI